MNNADANPEMPDATKCPECGTPLKGNALGGLCPACLLGQGATGDTVPAGKPSSFIPPSPDELVAFFPQFEILELIGRGGMGAVYKARQKQLDRVVALKILPPGIGNDPAFAERFTREAKALAKLNHSGIVTIHDFGVAESNEPNSPRLYYFIMEFVDGVTLRQLLNTSRVSSREALAIVPQICDALQFAHDHGIVHRDIKPENILLDRRGRVKVADFGLVKLVGGDAGAEEGDARLESPANWQAGKPALQITEADKVMGTPNYMAPEQKEKPAEVDHRADIYALGVVFYQLLTGELPGKQIEPPSRKVQIDVRLDEIVMRALEKNPEMRYGQASDLKTQVESFATSSSSGSEDFQTDEKPQKPDWRLWSPFQSPRVREIASHFTPEEKRDAQWRGMFWGFWCAGSAAALHIIITRLDGSLRWFSLIGLLIIQALVIPTWLRMQRQALSSTKWARERGITHKELRIFSFGADSNESERDSGHSPRPLSLKIIAAFFLWEGCSIAWVVVSSAIPHNWFHIAPAFLGIPIAIGLWRGRPWWRRIALAKLLIYIFIGLSVAFTTYFVGSTSNQTYFFGHEVNKELWKALNVSWNVFSILLYVWMLSVLIRPDVKPLFIKRGFNRPWLEWAVLIFVLVQMAFVPVLLRGKGGSSSGSVQQGVGTNSPVSLKPTSVRQLNGGPFIAHLPDGGSIELLAVRHHPTTNGTWWLPNGEASSYDPEITVEQEADVKPGVIGLARIVWPSDRKVLSDRFVTIETGRRFAVKDGRRLPIDDIGVMSFPHVIAEKGKATLMVNIGIGPWETLGRHKPGWISGLLAGERAKYWKFEEQVDGGLKVILEPVIMNQGMEYRLVAEDVSGKMHTPWTSATTKMSIHVWSRFEATFSGSNHKEKLPLKRLKEAHWQGRTYEHVQFRNVSLRPGYKTTVEVLDFGESSETTVAAEEKAEPGSNFKDYAVNETKVEFRWVSSPASNSVPVVDLRDPSGGKWLHVEKEILLDESHFEDAGFTAYRAGKKELIFFLKPNSRAILQKLTRENKGRQLVAIRKGAVVAMADIKSEIYNGLKMSLFPGVSASEANDLLKAFKQTEKGAGAVSKEKSAGP